MELYNLHLKIRNKAGSPLVLKHLQRAHTAILYSSINIYLFSPRDFGPNAHKEEF